ncbi:MAG: FapA family protein [Lachnospiraceae bacterium]|nr:FapA family protein [Lachnospiraceae bacterium]
MVSSGILGNAGYFTNDNNRGTYVRVTDDKMQAWLHLAEKPEDEAYTEDELLRLLVEQGVVFGVNQSSLVAMAKKRVYHREILVAEAMVPEKGTDGYYEYTFDIKAGKSKPVIREDGSVDYQSMRAVNSVKTGTLLATYHHAVPGKNGKDVCGNDIIVPMVQEKRSVAGRGIVQGRDDPDKYYAEKDGKVEMQSGKLNIVDVLEFSGDVDQHTGKLEFYGDVHIFGNVEAGTTIRAGKSLTIDGVVEAADLYAGGDIILKRGVQGSQKAHIGGKGNLFADFIEHSFVKVEGDIEANYVLSSYISTSGKLKLTGKKASLIGGNVYAMKGIECNTLGNASEIKTHVSSGVSDEMRADNEKIQNQLRDVRAEIQKIRQAVASMGSRITPEQQENYKALLQQQLTQQKLILDDQKQLFDLMEKARDSTIVIRDEINVGSEICIDGNILKIDKSNHSMEYRNISGMITGKVVVYR